MNLLTQRLSCLPRSHQSSDLVTCPVLHLKQLHAYGSVKRPLCPYVSETSLPLLQTVTENSVLGIPGSSGEEAGEHPGTCHGGTCPRSKGSLSGCDCSCPLATCSPANTSWNRKHFSKKQWSQVKIYSHKFIFSEMQLQLSQECLFLFRGKQFCHFWVILIQNSCFQDTWFRYRKHLPLPRIFLLI